MTIGRRLFAVGAAVLLAWTAAVEVVVRGGERPAPARTSQLIAGRPVSAAATHPRITAPRITAPRITAPRITAPPATTHAITRPARPDNGAGEPPRPAANDAADPAAAGPAVIRDPALTGLARRWCTAYLRWGREPRGSAAAALRVLSTPELSASLAARPPLPAGAPESPVTVGQIQLFAATAGYSAIVDLDGDGADVVLELLITPTASGPRVSALYL